MRITHIGPALAPALLLLCAAHASAQDTPTVFLHGLASSGGTWQNAATRLSARAAITPQRPDLNWRDTLESQADRLQTALGGLPGSTIAVGHSNGGLVARQWSRLRPVGGIVTLGTPHQGAPLAYNALRWLDYNYAVGSVITEVFNAFGRNCCAWSGVFFQVRTWIDGIRYWLSLESAGLASTLGIQIGAPVLSQMSTGSPAGLNSSANLGREASAVPARVGIAVVAHNFYYAGPFRAIWPEDGDTIAAWMSTTVNTLNYFASYISLTADPSDTGAMDLVSWLYAASAWISSIDPTWCHYISSGSASSCSANDTVVPDWSQAYPNAPLIYIPREGPAHIRETNQSDDWLYTALTNYMHLGPRSASPPPPPGGSSPPPSSSTNTLLSGQWINPNQAIRSSDGRFQLAYQGDGNLVLYRWDGAALWSSRTFGTSPGEAVMQGDGNFVVYNSGGTALWASGTYGNPGASLKIQNDGNVVVYSANGTPLWATGTYGY